MIRTEDIDQSILRGVDYLHQHQFPNGEFCVYMGFDDNLTHTIPYSNVFPTSLICYSLLHLRHLSKVKQMLELSSLFLQFQSMRAGVWNNFTSWNPLFKTCPADVDNTSCASKVLQELGKDYPENKNIILKNRNKLGLFYTWYTLRPNLIFDKNYWLLILREYKNPIKSFMFWHKFECSRNDIDAVVNANVLFYLGLNDNTKPLINYMINIIKQNKEDDCDEWYRNPFSIYYFFSRNYKKDIIELEPLKQPIIDRILETAKENGSIGASILDTAFGVISLLNLNYYSPIIEDAVAYLIKNQQDYGNWQRWVVYYGGAKKLSSFGSEEFTTGFCLEALALYKETQDK